MSEIWKRLVWWVPRVGGIVFAGFLSLFALDSFNRGHVVEAVPAALHLIPSVLVLAAVASGWKSAPIGAVAFVALAVAYALIAGERLDWILTISGPLLLIGVLFLVNWRQLRPGTAKG